MDSVNQLQFEGLDEEWTTLILAARKLGLSIDEIRAFLRRGRLFTMENAGQTEEATHAQAKIK